MNIPSLDNAAALSLAELHWSSYTCPAMSDQHLTALATVWQAIFLFLTLLAVGGYLWETRRLRVAAQQQVRSAHDQLEAQIRPAVVVETGGEMDT